MQKKEHIEVKDCHWLQVQCTEIQLGYNLSLLGNWFNLLYVFCNDGKASYIDLSKITLTGADLCVSVAVGK